MKLHNNKPLRLICVAIILGIISAYLYTATHSAGRVMSESMLPTLQVGADVQVNRLAYVLSEPKRGDIISFYDTISNRELVKRVIAVGGDHLIIKTTGHMTINGKSIEEPYLYEQNWRVYNDIDLVVEPNTIFVMGDNRNNSIDSRSLLGLVSVKHVHGKVMAEKQK